MVTIPTTDRKYYDTTRKVNAMAEYAGALLPAAKQYQQVVYEAEKSRIYTEESSAKLEMNELTTNWRLQNLRNPFNEESLQQLQVEYDAIISQHRENIDPVLRDKWDMVGNQLKSNFQISNQTWGFNQTIRNEKEDFDTFAKNTVKNVSYDKGLTPSEAANATIATVIDHGASLQTVSDKDVAEKASKAGRESFINMFRYYLDNGNTFLAEEFLNEQSGKKLNDENRVLTDKDISSLRNDIEKAKKTEKKLFNEKLLVGEVTREELEDHYKKYPDQKAVHKQKKYKEPLDKLTPKQEKPKKGDIDDFEKTIEDSFSKNDEAYEIYPKGSFFGYLNKLKEATLEILTGDTRIKNRDEYESNNFKIAQILCDDINNSKNLLDEDKVKLKKVIAHQLTDRNYSDDISSIMAEYETILGSYGTYQVDVEYNAYGVLPGESPMYANSTKSSPVKEVKRTLSETAERYMQRVVDEMSNITDREKYLSTLKNKTVSENDEFNSIRDQRMETIQEIQKEFLMESISNSYGVPLSVLRNLKKGDTFALPAINNHTVVFNGWTTTDMIVDTKRGN